MTSLVQPLTLSFGPLSDVAMFTHRNGMTMLQIQHELRSKLNELIGAQNAINAHLQSVEGDLAVQINAQLAQLQSNITLAELLIDNSTEAIDANIAAATVAIDAAIRSANAAANEANVAAQLAAGANDMALSQLVENPNSATGALLLSRYVMPAGKVGQEHAQPLNYINVKDFGTVGDGIVDDTDHVKAAQEFAESVGEKMWFPSGTYRMLSGLIVDVDKTGLFGAQSILDFSELAYGDVAVTFTASDPAMLQRRKTRAVDGMVFVGPGSLSGTTGFFLSGPSNECGIIGVPFYDFTISHFGTGISLGSNAFTLNFVNADITSCGLIYDDSAAVTNAGERITFTGCMFNNSVDGFKVKVEAFLNGCSIDYIRGVSVWANNGQVFLNGCHLENGGDAGYYDAPILRTSGLHGTIVWSVGSFLFTTESSRNSYVRCDVPGTVKSIIIRDVYADMPAPLASNIDGSNVDNVLLEFVGPQILSAIDPLSSTVSTTV